MIFCGVDIGTTNTKAILLDGDGRIMDRMTIKQARRENLHRIDPQIWYEHLRGVLENFRGHFKGESVYVSVSSQGGSFAVVDRNFNALEPAWVWTGQARESTVKEIESKFGAVEYYHSNGWQPLGFLMAGKLREYFAGGGRSVLPGQKLVTTADYVMAKLTGKAVTDVTNAQMTGAFDIGKQEWRRDVLEWAGCGDIEMPEIAAGVKVLFENIKTEWGAINLVTSSHDQYAAMKAAGVESGSAMLATGTAWVLNGKTDGPIYDDENFSVHPGRDLYGGYGFIATLGSVGQGFEELLHQYNISYAKLKEIENRIELKSKLDDVSGAIADYMQMVAEQTAELIEASGTAKRLKKIMMTGGAAQSGIWPKLIAAKCGIEVETVEFAEFTAYGAALYAMEAERKLKIER